MGRWPKCLYTDHSCTVKPLQLFGRIIIHNEVRKDRKINESGAKVDYIYPRKCAALFKTLKIRFIRQSSVDQM